MNADSSGTRILDPHLTAPSPLGPEGSSNALYHTKLVNSPFAPKQSLHKYPFLTPSDRPDELGRLGQYRVLGTLGVGGMGYVFHAIDDVLHRHVALKVMKPDLDETGHPELRFK